MNQRRKRSSTSRPAVSLEPLYQSGTGDIVRQDDRTKKGIADPNDSEVNLRSTGKSLDKSKWDYPKVPLKQAGIFVGVASLLIAWAYWPTWGSLIAAWIKEPDYSHGWFVIPIVGYLLWNLNSTRPALRAGFHVGGLLMLLGVILLRVISRWAFFDSMDGWTIPLALISLSWVVGGRAFFLWSLPAMLFLFFMVPLPYRVESELSRPLQWIATRASTFTLQLLGQPAISEGTTILLGEQTLEVERACSGLRIFVGIFALSYVYAMLARRNWWEGVIIVLASIPIALIANMSRIVITGLCYQWLNGDAAKKFSHDLAGYFMIGLAAGLFAMLVFYLRWLIQDAQTIEQVALRRA
ncbi:MAG: exosortase/archaeosortase family protein [Planctomycetota bacterium]|nr:exosortase/archaeosortase family protein [Planctomycetota bacterium]